jgi:hypothetical protein
MKRILVICILTGLILLLAGCNIGRYYSSDPFYSSTGEWDSIRFPLLKPYEAVSIVGGNGWGINLPVILGEPNLYGSVQDVQKISVVNDVILAYTPNKPNISQEMLEQIQVYYWYVIIPDMKIQRGFENEVEFQNYIQERGINEVNWENPDSLYQRFEKTGCLEWIPGCE